MAPGLVVLGLRPWIMTHSGRPAMSMDKALQFVNPKIVFPEKPGD
jgi:hypothetical protein